MVEFDRYLSQLQGCLVSFQCILDNLTDSEKICELCSRLEKILEKCPPDYEKRNLFLYLLLNSDAEAVNDIAEDDNYSHLINTAPPQSLILVLKVIMKLDGLKFLTELVSFATPALAVAVMDSLLSDLQFDLSSLKELMTVTVHLSKACYQRLVFTSSKNRTLSQKFLSYFKLLQNLSFPSQNTIASHPLGAAFLQSLEVCQFCFLNEDEMKDHSQRWDGFKVNIEVMPDMESCDLDIDYETLKECRSLVISKCKQLSQAISLDDWLNWCEVEIEPSKNMQKLIGETAFDCSYRLNNLGDQTFEDLPEFLEILSNFVIKPHHEEDEVQDASLDEIMANLSNSQKNSKIWVKAFLQRNSILNCAESINIIRRFSTLFDEDNVEYLLGKIAEQLLAECVENQEMLQDLSYQIMKHLSFESLVRIFQKCAHNYGLSMVFCGRDFEPYLMEAFNRTYESDDESTKWQCEIVRLSILNTRAVVNHALKSAILDHEAIRTAMKILVLLRPLSADIVTEWVSEVSSLSCLHGVELDHFPQLAMELIRENFLSQEIFTKLHIMHGIYQDIHTGNWESVSMWLTVLQCVLNGIGNETNKLCRMVVLLAYVGQVIEFCQQPMNTFTLSCVVTRQKAISLLQSVRQIHLSKMDRNWLHNFISNFSTITQCHMKVFACGDEMTAATDEHPISLFDNIFDDKVKTPEYAACILVPIVPFLTVYEWSGLAAILKRCFSNHDDSTYLVFQAFQQTLLLLATVCPGSGVDNESNYLSCLNYCIRCLGTIIKTDILPNTNHRHFLPVLEETLQLLSKLPTEVWDKGGMYILPVLVNLMQEIPFKMTSLNSLSALVTLCPINQGRALLENKIKEVFQEPSCSQEVS